MRRYKKVKIFFVSISLVIVSCFSSSFTNKGNSAQKYSSYAFSKLDELIKADVREGFPGGQLLVMKNGKVIHYKNFGYVSDYTPAGVLKKNRRKVRSATLYDLASNTKMYAVNYALQHLISIKKLKLTTKVKHYIPDFKDSPNDKIKGKDTLRIVDILHHTSGFPADPQYWNKYYNPNDPNQVGINPLYSLSKKKTLKMICKTPLIYAPRTDVIYSDVDYMILGFVIEKITKMSLDKYVTKALYKPLGLKKITYKPISYGYSKWNIAATELNGNSRDGAIKNYPANFRHGVIRGTVHDEKAYYSMGGVSGHAGLFANAKTLAKLANVMLTKGKYKAKVKGKKNKYKTKSLFSKSVVKEFTTPYNLNNTYALGWRINGPEKGYSAVFSTLASEEAIGHTGWTGTLTIIDPKTKSVIVWLSNKKNSPVYNKEEDPNTFLGDIIGPRNRIVAYYSYMGILNWTNAQVDAGISSLK